MPRQRIEAVFEGAGFGLAAHRIVEHPVAPNWAAFADKMAHRADSFVASLPDGDFREGMAALRAYAEQVGPEEAVMENIDLFIFRRSPG